SAFRTLFHSVGLPLCNELNDLFWGRKNRTLALDNLRRAMRTFPSLYQLMPPQRDLYLYAGFSGGDFNPLHIGQQVINNDHKTQADAVHQAIATSTTLITQRKISAHTIAGIDLSRQTDVRYKVFVDTSDYEVLNPIPYAQTQV